MSPGVALGLLLAIATALASIFGFLYKQRGAVEAPPVEWRHPWRTSIALFRHRAYTIGMIVATAGWGLHVGALSLAPISLVQATIAGCLVLLTVIADQAFEHRVTRREWIGVALTAAGLAFLAATLEGTGREAHADYEPATLAIYASALVLTAVLVVALARGETRTGSLFGLAAGLMWGASDISIKALSGSLDQHGFGVMIHPLAAVILTLSLAGLVVSARSLQLGPAVPVIAVTSAAANITTIAAGPIVFGEPLPGNAVGVTVRLLAFVLVIGAAALTPPPRRSASASSAPA
jgi:hypothetical protein